VRLLGRPLARQLRHDCLTGYFDESSVCFSSHRASHW